MPRISPFSIHLSSAEEAELQRRAGKYTLPYFQVQRAKMILLAAEGLNNDEMAARLDSRREVVGRWRKRFFTDRLQGLEEQARPGRPRTFSPQTSSCQLRLGLANCPPPTTFRCRGGVAMILRAKCVRRGWWLQSVAAPSGGGAPRRHPPWYHRSWIFPRDPNCAEKAGRLLDLYAREWEGKPLKDDEFVISADEKTSMQARRRKPTTQACRPRRARRVEHEYFRGGAWAYRAALDVHHARVFGRGEAKNGIAPFDRLVEQVMTRPPYNDARRVFWIVDNCSAHRGAKAAQRLRDQYPRWTLVHAPVHASWLNPVEIYFSIVQRKVLSPNDFPSLEALAERLLDFQYYWESASSQFEWKFTRQDLADLLTKLTNRATP